MSETAGEKRSIEVKEEGVSDDGVGGVREEGSKRMRRSSVPPDRRSIILRSREPLSLSHARYERKRVECVEANNSLGLLSRSRSRSRLRESWEVDQLRHTHRRTDGWWIVVSDSTTMRLAIQQERERAAFAIAVC